MWLQVLRQASEELSDVDEVHLQQDVLVQAQDAQSRTEQTLLPIPTEDVPHPTRHVQGEGLTVQSEDPGWRQVKTPRYSEISKLLVLPGSSDVKFSVYTLLSPSLSLSHPPFLLPRPPAFDSTSLNTSSTSTSLLFSVYISLYLSALLLSLFRPLLSPHLLLPQPLSSSIRLPARPLWLLSPPLSTTSIFLSFPSSTSLSLLLTLQCMGQTVNV